MNPSIRIYINKIVNRITFKIKTSQNLTLETMKLLGSTKSKITKNDKSENVPNLEISEVVLAHFNIVNNNYQQNSRAFYSLKILYFKKLVTQNFRILKYGIVIKLEYNI